MTKVNRCFTVCNVILDFIPRPRAEVISRIHAHIKPTGKISQLATMLIRVGVVISGMRVPMQMICPMKLMIP